MDLSGQETDIHIRTDAKNLVTTATTTHLPEQAETVHMITQLRQEALSGSIHDLAHVVTQDCLSDCLTKSTAQPKNLIDAVNTGILPNCDRHPSFRELMSTRHKAYFTYTGIFETFMSAVLPPTRRIKISDQESGFTKQKTCIVGQVLTHVGIPIA